MVVDAHDWLAGARRAVTDWRNWHRFMTTQALGLGTAALSVGIALEWSARSLEMILVVTAIAVVVGSLIKQPEVGDD